MRGMATSYYKKNIEIKNFKKLINSKNMFNIRLNNKKHILE